MNTTFLDECFKARMDYLRGRFPLEDFRKKFKEEYARRGVVMMQPTIVSTLSEGVTHDCSHGFLFKTQHNLDFALWLVRRWGFSVTKRCEHEGGREYTAYIVQLSDEYLRRQVGSDKAGIIRTGLRTLSNVDRTKKQKPSDYSDELYEHEFHELLKGIRL